MGFDILMVSRLRLVQDNAANTSKWTFSNVYLLLSEIW